METTYWETGDINLLLVVRSLVEAYHHDTGEKYNSEEMDKSK